jgi:hypothetical protein
MLQAERRLARARRTTDVFPDCVTDEDRRRIEEAQTAVLFNQFHDTLGGTCIAEANLTCAAEFLAAASTATDVTTAITRRALRREAQPGLHKIVVFNPTGFDYTGPVQHEPWLEANAFVHKDMTPFPYELEEHRIDVHSVSARKPLFMDESCHDWKLIRLGRSLGWTGVALKTCKTQTGALLSLCWARAHGMTLMVQDLTNPMLAQIPHCLLAANAGTIMGVETNAMQFYPAASAAEEKVHPGLYKRRNGSVTMDTLQGPGFGYRVDEITRDLPEPVFGSR